MRKNKKNVEKKIIELFRNRLKALEIEKRLYEQNSNLMGDVKTLNIELIQNDILHLRELLQRK